MVNQITDVSSAYKYLATSPMFKLSLSSKELFHSNFLEWLSNVDQIAFKRLILVMAGINENEYNWPAVWRVKREYNNFDLCIVAYDQFDNNDIEEIEDNEDFRILFVIENKVKSIPYKEQLERYAKEAEVKNKVYWNNRAKALLNEHGLNSDNKDKKYWIGIENGKWVLKQGKKGSGKSTQWSSIKYLNESISDESDGKQNKTKFIECYKKRRLSECPSINFILLSLAKSFPEYNDKGDWQVKWKDGVIDREVQWKVCNYSTYHSIISEKFKKVPDGLNSQIIEDYCRFIECLTTLSSKWEEDYKDYNNQKQFLYKDNENYKNAHRIRIHDLYQKLKFSYLCTQLYNEIKDHYKGYSVFPSNQGGLFKEKDIFTPDKKYICVNYTYLHGEPLLEINVHPATKELYYVIQVQGNAYEHGILVKDKNAKDVWDKLIKGEMTIIDGWMNMNINNIEWEGPNFKDDSQEGNKGNNKYNKYDMNDGTYVYQKYIINSDATIKGVLDQMLKDLKYVIDQTCTTGVNT